MIINEAQDKTGNTDVRAICVKGEVKGNKCDHTVTTGSPDEEGGSEAGPALLNLRNAILPCGFSDAFSQLIQISKPVSMKQENLKNKLIQAGICENWWVLEI